MTRDASVGRTGALGFSCVSPAGPDGEVDILAGSGPLGLDSPTLIVEVKSESTAVDVKVVRGLPLGHDAAPSRPRPPGPLPR